MGDVFASVVIPVLNAEDTLGAQLEALSRQKTDLPWEIVISDNGSTDRTGMVIDSWRPRLPCLRVVDASERRGVSYARNVGVGAARAEVVLICDADDVVSPGWIDALTAGVALADVVGGPFDEVTLNDPISVTWRGSRPKDRLPTALGFLPFVVGANIAFRKSVFLAIGGWDESYVDGGDDIDFSWRAQLSGFSVGFSDEALVAYRHRSDSHLLRRQFYRYGKAGPKLYAQYRKLGARRRPVRRALRSWVWLVVRSIDLVRGPVHRGRYLRALGQLSGRLVGSVQNRVIYL